MIISTDTSYYHTAVLLVVMLMSTNSPSVSLSEQDHKLKEVLAKVNM